MARTHTTFGVVLALLALAAPPALAAERIFADGFELCCQIGGTVSGLTGNGLVLHLTADGGIAEDRPITRNGLYRFAASVPPGSPYAVNIAAQPGAQSCNVANASGTMGSADIDNVDVACGATPALVWDQGDWGELWQ